MDASAKDTPLQKRVKRHVSGRQREFFISTQPGLEELALGELKCILPEPGDAAVVPGGVVFRGRLRDCCLANLQLRTAGRILMRAAVFKATNFRQLERQTREVPWELYLYSQAAFGMRVAARGSRLYHRKAIAERMESCIRERLAKFGMERDASRGRPIDQILFVRAENDQFTLSVDSSGRNLHKRGIKRTRTPAPIRESTASAVLMLSGYTHTEPLIDPMCGSGTFSLEGAMMAKGIPAGWSRDFAFMDWPAFRPRQWEYLKRQAGTGITRVARPRIFASDTDERACRGLGKIIDEHGLSDIVTVTNADFFSLSPERLTDQVGLVVINPPYGRRMGARRDSAKLLEAICARLKERYLGWRLALIAPRKHLGPGVPLKLTARPLYHGGLHLTLFEGTIQ